MTKSEMIAQLCWERDRARGVLAQVNRLLNEEAELSGKIQFGIKKEKVLSPILQVARVRIREELAKGFPVPEDVANM